MGLFFVFRQNLTGGLHGQALEAWNHFLVTFNQCMTAAAQCDQVVVLQLQRVIGSDGDYMMHFESVVGYLAIG